MAHALRRISYATCDPEHAQFSFLAREPKGHFSLQYCHSFLAQSADQVGHINVHIGFNGKLLWFSTLCLVLLYVFLSDSFVYIRAFERHFKIRIYPNMHPVNLKTAIFTHQDTSVDRISVYTKQCHVLEVKVEITLSTEHTFLCRFCFVIFCSYT